MTVIDKKVNKGKRRSRLICLMEIVTFLHYKIKETLNIAAIVIAIGHFANNNSTFGYMQQLQLYQQGTVVGAALIGTGHSANSCSYIHATVAVIYMPTPAVILTGYYADSYFPPLVLCHQLQLYQRAHLPTVAGIPSSHYVSSCRYIQYLQLLIKCSVGITAAASTVPSGYNCSC